MTIQELVKAVKLKNQRILGSVDEKRAAAIARGVLTELGKQLNETKEGEILLPGFGKFIIKEVQLEKGGKKTAARRFIFRASKPKKKAAKAY